MSWYYANGELLKRKPVTSGRGTRTEGLNQNCPLAVHLPSPTPTRAEPQWKRKDEDALLPQSCTGGGCGVGKGAGGLDWKLKTGFHVKIMAYMVVRPNCPL